MSGYRLRSGEDAVQAPDEPAPGRRKRASSKKMRALVVDDSATMRRITVSALERLGFEEVEEAGTGKEALRLLARKKKCHLVCTAWNMPEMDGIELVHGGRSRDPLAGGDRCAAGSGS